MEINNINTTSLTPVNEKSILQKDDFLKLLITELKFQDPTEPMDSDKILQQTSQLATLEASKNTTEAMTTLTNSIKTSMQFNTISAIGKMADIGNNDVTLNESGSVNFDLFFSKDIEYGNIYIKDLQGNIIKTISLDKQNGGMLNFNWDGYDDNGNKAEAGVYHISSDYTTINDEHLSTKVGIYPISSVMFDEGKAMLKLGSNYVELDRIKEIF